MVCGRSQFIHMEGSVIEWDISNFGTLSLLVPVARHAAYMSIVPRLARYEISLLCIRFHRSRVTGDCCGMIIGVIL